MTPTNRLPLIILILLLILSNAFWACTYFMSIQHRNDALKEGSTTLAIILANTGTLLKEAGTKGQDEYLEVAYMLVDHALLVAQTLDKLTGNNDWTHKVVSAIASLHDLLASTHQGYTISKDKLMKVGDTLEKLSEALKNLDTESIKQYSQELESLLTQAARL